jgi:hypothetical protein
MTDDREALGRLVRRVWTDWALEQADPKPSWLDTWSELDDGQREVDMRIGAAVAKAERERIAALLQAQADREQEAADAFPGDPGFIGAARASRVAVLIAKGEVGGEGLMP